MSGPRLPGHCAALQSVRRSWTDTELPLGCFEQLASTGARIETGHRSCVSAWLGRGVTTTTTIITAGSNLGIGTHHDSFFLDRFSSTARNFRDGLVGFGGRVADDVGARDEAQGNVGAQGGLEVGEAHHIHCG